jgi:hypothetical protein
MRTTLTIDDDLERALRQRARELGLGWKEVVNRTLREGLVKDAGKAVARTYQTQPFDPGPPRLVGVHSVHDLLSAAEGEAYR